MVKQDLFMIGKIKILIRRQRIRLRSCLRLLGRPGYCRSRTHKLFTLCLIVKFQPIWEIWCEYAAVGNPGACHLNCELQTLPFTTDRPLFPRMCRPYREQASNAPESGPLGDVYVVAQDWHILQRLPIWLRRQSIGWVPYAGSLPYVIHVFEGSWSYELRRTGVRRFHHVHEICASTLKLTPFWVSIWHSYARIYWYVWGRSTGLVVRQFEMANYIFLEHLEEIRISLEWTHFLKIPKVLFTLFSTHQWIFSLAYRVY